MTESGASAPWTINEPWHYECPYCGAPKGQSCRPLRRGEPLWRGKPRPSHRARLLLAASAANGHEAP